MTRGWFSCHTGELGTPTKTVTYRYDDAAWGDLLTEYDGTAITYDEIGNPLTYGGRTYTWRHGRQLATLTENGTTWTNTYDADGMRVSRSNGTVAYSYIYSGSKLRQMTVGTDVLTFTYDAAGIPMSLSYNGTEYYYVTNLQGDVVGILDSAGQQVVAYSYDAWGKLLSTTGPMANTLGVHNPLRYRGYVYDTETALYYLQSRYYDPNLGRFLNADSFAATGQGLIGNNTFAYCNNNPIMYLDPNGMLSGLAWVIIGVCVVAGAIIGACSNTKLKVTYQENTKKQTYTPPSPRLPQPPESTDLPNNDFSFDQSEEKKKSNKSSTTTPTAEPEKLTVGDRVTNAFIGATVGLMVGGLLVSGAGAVGSVCAGSASAMIKLFGATGAQVFATGALAYNTGAIISFPLFGAQIELIEYS